MQLSSPASVHRGVSDFLFTLPSIPVCKDSNVRLGFEHRLFMASAVNLFFPGGGMAEIDIIIADITTLDVDAVVNAANSTLLGGGGVDGAIHRAAGSSLLDECMTLGGCPTGEARITGGYNLPARFIIHTVGPVYHDGTEGEHRFLGCCYQNSLKLAVANKCRSVAFPAISCGAYGFPIDEAAIVAMQQTLDFLKENDSFDRIIFACASADVHAALDDAYRSDG